MQIKDMFVKPIDRDLQGVIIVGQDKNENIKQELEEYVVTKELQKHFADFFAAYKKGIIGSTTKIGVWISGFFGSGKSHLLKIIAYLLENREITGKKAIDYFIDDNKISDSMVLADIQLAANTPTDVVLFDIDSKGDSNGKEKKDAIVNVFLKVFNEMQGYCGAIPALADLERKLNEDGRYEEFKGKFAEQYGTSWNDSRNDFDYIQDDIIKVLADMDYMSAEAGRNWCEKAMQPYSIAIEDFAKRVKKYLDIKGNNHHIVFLADEMGQYIADDADLMLNLQTITEDLGVACNGKAWVVVTSQQDIDSVTKVKGRDFSKIQGRFDTRISLSSANADTVIKKRILEKTDTAAQMLRLLYGQKETTIKNKVTFTDQVERKLYKDENDFSEVYPFIPYQFNLLASVLTAIRTHSSSGKHLSEGERSMLAMFKESAMTYKNDSEGTLIPFSAFYKPMESFLDHSHRSVIIKAYDNNLINPDHKDTGVFAIDVLKVLFLIKYVQDITANVDNITTLMLSSIDDDRITLRTKVEEALKVLTRQMLVQKNGDTYIFLTDEEQEINREIESEDIDSSAVIYKVSELIFEDIFKDNKYHDPRLNGRYSFGFNQTVDDRIYKSNQNNDISVHILTPAAAVYDDSTLRMMSGQANEVLIVLPNDRSFMDEIQTYLKIEKFLRRISSASSMNYRDIKDSKYQEMRDRGANAKLFLMEAFKEADIYVYGDKVDVKQKDASARMNEALDKLVERVYNKLFYIDVAMNEDSIRKLFDTDNQVTLQLENVKQANSLAVNDVLAYIAANSNVHAKTSMKTIKERFMKAPYGFVEDDVDWLVAKLFKSGNLVFTVNGVVVNLLNKQKEEIINYIVKKQYAEKLLIEQREKISDREKKICHDVMSDLFRISSVNDDEDEMMQMFMRYSNQLIEELNRLEVRYEAAPYPGKKVVIEGKNLLEAAAQTQSTTEFFAFVKKNQDELKDFGTYYEPIKEFFSGEQMGIFDKALKFMKIFSDSKEYIVDKNIEDTADRIQNIVEEQEPYSDIQKLPELLDKFGKSYNTFLDVQLEPVMSSINSSNDRVMEVLDKKQYADDYRSDYQMQFDKIREDAKHSNNVAALRNCADRAEALKMRFLDEMTAKDNELAKIAEEEQQKAKDSNGTDEDHPNLTPKTHIKRTKNIQIKTVIHTSSWRLESEEDIEKYVAALRQELTSELDDDTIINIEF